VERTFDRHVGEAWIERVRGDGERERDRDELAVEAPLEIRVDGEALAVTMRTPGEDEELAVGFLAGEGLIGGPEDVVAVGPTADFAANVVEVRTRAGLRRDAAGERRFYLSSSCGVCGKGALEHVRQVAPPSDAATPPLESEVVLRAPAEARAAQRAFERTGGLHATALFEPGGDMLVLREDVGRHNAMDKSIGSMILAGRFPLPGVFACLSGRASFELVQKASLAGLAGLVAVGAPSTLAVELARERDMLLCGFVRDRSFNVYAGSDRLVTSSRNSHPSVLS
jgi:FdhD protein